jgi:hypothetical protein
MKLLTTYMSFRDLNVGNFVLMNLHDLDLVPLYIGKVESDIIRDEDIEHFKMVKVQRWVPVKK